MSRSQSRHRGPIRPHRISPIFSPWQRSGRAHPRTITHASPARKYKQKIVFHLRASAASSLPNFFLRWFTDLHPSTDLFAL